MVELLGEFGFSSAAARAALTRLVTRDYLARVKVGRMVRYALTSHAQEVLADGDRRIFSFGRSAPAADTWTMVWHAVPDDRRVERAQMASQLRFLGFGSLQDATWIAASNREQEVRALFSRLGVTEFGAVLVGRLTPGSESALLHSGAWDLDELERLYADFLAEFGPHVDRVAPLSDREAFLVRTRMIHAFRGFAQLDPELSVNAARRAEVVEVFDAVYARLEPQAVTHFAVVAGTEPPG